MSGRHRFLYGLTLLLAVSAGPVSGHGNAEAASGVDPAGPREYRWETGDGWSPIERPTNPPGRNGRDRVTFRLALRKNIGRNSVLFIPSADTAFEASISGVPVYAFGMTGGEPGVRFAGWPWHFVPLPERAPEHRLRGPVRR